MAQDPNAKPGAAQRPAVPVPGHIKAFKVAGVLFWIGFAALAILGTALLTLSTGF